MTHKRTSLLAAELLVATATASCLLGPQPAATPAGPTAPRLGPTSTSTSPPPSEAGNPSPPSATATSSATSVHWPDGLVVAYARDGQLWSWSAGTTRLIVERPGLWRPRVSPDGQWIAFLEEEISIEPPSIEQTVSVIAADGGDLSPLITPESLASLADGGPQFLADDFDWSPDGLSVLFNTVHLTEGPPGFWPNFDLYSVDLEGNTVQVAPPGEGGEFTPSPDGRYVAVASDTRIGVIDLQTRQRRTLLRFSPLLMACECLYIPDVAWIPDSMSILVSIPPPEFLYPDEYHGEPEQVWRLPVEGAPILITELAPIPPDQAAVVSFSPDGSRLAYLQPSPDSCRDRPALYVRDLSTSAEQGPLHCFTEPLMWTPDSDHYVIHLGQGWQLGSIHDATTEPLEFIKGPEPKIAWIDDAYFLLTLSGQTSCTVSIATLEGISTEIVRSEPHSCPSVDIGFLTDR